MSKKIKSGKEIIDDFFKDIESIEGVDREIVSALTELYNENKLSKINIESKLEEMRNTES